MVIDYYVVVLVTCLAPESQYLTPTALGRRGLFWVMFQSTASWLGAPRQDSVAEGPGGSELVTAWWAGSRVAKEGLGRDTKPRPH